MSTPKGFYTSRVTVEIEFVHQGEPSAQLILSQLKCPAVKAIKFVSAETNYRLHDVPAETFHSVNFSEELNEAQKFREEAEKRRDAF